MARSESRILYMDFQDLEYFLRIAQRKKIKSVVLVIKYV